MKKYLVLSLFLLSTTMAFSQSDYQDVIYLKDGSIIRGLIIEQVPNKSIKIETVIRNVFVYQMDQIEKITKEPYLKSKNNILSNSGLTSGYKGIIELGYQIGIDKNSYGFSDRLKLNIINGYQVNPFFSVGLGTGLRYYSKGSDVLIPVFADLRTNLTDKKISPFLSLGIGYSFDASNQFKGTGVIFNPSAGVTFKVSEKSSLNVGIDYEIQNVNFSNYGYSGSENLNAIGINAGLSF